MFNDRLLRALLVLTDLYLILFNSLGDYLSIYFSNSVILISLAYEKKLVVVPSSALGDYFLLSGPKPL